MLTERRELLKGNELGGAVVAKLAHKLMRRKMRVMV